MPFALSNIVSSHGTAASGFGGDGSEAAGAEDDGEDDGEDVAEDVAGPPPVVMSLAQAVRNIAAASTTQVFTLAR